MRWIQAKLGHSQFRPYEGEAMRKIHALSVVAAFILTPLLLLMVGVGYTSGEVLEVAPLNPDFEEVSIEMAQGTYRAAVTEEGRRLGYLPPPVDLRFLEQHPMALRIAPQAVPTAWDLRSVLGYNAITPVKDQGSCGSCWAFGNLGAVESKYKIETAGHPNLDLSENNMISDECKWPFAWKRCDGGNTNLATAYLTMVLKKSPSTGPRQKGAVLESADPYNSSSIFVDTKCGWGSRPNPSRRINGTRWVAKNTATMKDAMYSRTTPLVTAFHWDGSFYNSTTRVYYHPGCTHSSNHEVLIVGWDNNKAHPGGQGCWIVKNSWGATWGGTATNPGDGYFYIPYDTGNVGSDNMYYRGSPWAAATRAYNSAEYFYMEDLPGLVSVIGWGSTTNPYGYGATVFAPGNTGEKLVAVEFFSVMNNMPYEIKVYGTVTDVSPGVVAFSNLLTTKTGTCEEAGYYSIPVSLTSLLTKGQRYGVQVKFKTTLSGGKYYPVPVAYELAGYTYNFVGSGLTNSTSYARSGDTGNFGRVVIGGTTSVPCVRVRTNIPL
ncbi:MAG: hypothetical protein FJ126_00725 [Deltaproteobacteria bacterium]|nr:hypothetical protein [Deltaproteobacteria bacterium]